MSQPIAARSGIGDSLSLLLTGSLLVCLVERARTLVPTRENTLVK